MSLKTRDRRFMARSAAELEIAASTGNHVVDAQGRRYLDFVMGWCVGNLGWGREEVRRAIAEFDGPDYVHPEHLYAPWVDLAELLAEITPGKLQRSYRATGGTEAVEIALQVAMAHTGRRRFVSLEGSYHGNSIATLSIGSVEGDRLPNRLANCRQLAPPLDARAAAKVETLLRGREVAAFVMEPVACNLGVLVPEPEFMERLAALCKRYGTLLVADEVATGFGRTGKLFACEHFDLEPDVLCLGKAITGGYAGMGATVLTAEVADSVADEVDAWSTYGWHPRSVAAALANLRYLVEHRDRLLADVVSMGEYFERRLGAMSFADDAEVRVKGLAIAVELGDETYVERVGRKARDRGLLLSAEGDTLMLLPALTIDRATAAEGLDILERCL
jgi:4-aminobutyrate aminotransferase-like enzyme